MRERVKDKREAGEGRREGGKRRKKREGAGEPGKRWGRTERAEGTLERITLSLGLQLTKAWVCSSQSNLPGVHPPPKC